MGTVYVADLNRSVGTAALESCMVHCARVSATNELHNRHASERMNMCGRDRGRDEVNGYVHGKSIICFVQATMRARADESLWKFLRPQLLSLPFSIRALVECVSESPRLLRITEISLFYRIRHNDYETPVLACNRVVEIVCLLAECEVFIVVGLGSGLARRWVLERACNEQLV
jgi:hypothetical protein